MQLGLVAGLLSKEHNKVKSRARNEQLLFHTPLAQQLGPILPLGILP